MQLCEKGLVSHDLKRTDSKVFCEHESKKMAGCFTNDCQTQVADKFANHRRLMLAHVWVARTVRHLGQGKISNVASHVSNVTSEIETRPKWRVRQTVVGRLSFKELVVALFFVCAASVDVMYTADSPVLSTNKGTDFKPNALTFGQYGVVILMLFSVLYLHNIEFMGNLGTFFICN